MRYDNREVLIPTGQFQKFENGEPVEVDPPDDVALEAGDVIGWSVSPNLEGSCEVLRSEGEKIFVIKRD